MSGTLPGNEPKRTMSREDIEKAITGLRFNQGKLRWELLPDKALEPMIRVLEYGAKKYTDNNWQKGLVLPEILACLQRHLVALKSGETHDEESGQPHIGHILCNAMFYSYFTEVHPEKAITNVSKS